MGLLDDLKSQAEQKNKPSQAQQTPADAVEFYRAHIKQRMVMANNFFIQLANQLKEMKLVVRAEYPFKPEGKNVSLLQQEYKAYSDSIPEPRQITFSFTCTLANPTIYEINGRAPAMAQGELLDRYQFKYERLEVRDQNQMVSGAKYKLHGPLKIRCVLQYDDARQIIKLLLTNFAGPGTSQYNLKPEQLDQAFMDHLGKYLLRKEANLFQEEIADDVKAMLRKKLQEEQLQREAEIRAVEEQRKAEEAVRKQNSATEKLKKSVTQSVAENREKLKKVMDEQVKEKGEKLKTMFNKLKKQAGFDSTDEQASVPPAAAKQVPVPPPVTPASVGNNPVAPHLNPGQAARPAAQPATQGVPPTANRQAAQTAPAQPNPAASPKPSVAQAKPTPPKVFQSSTSNPFLKPEDFEPVPEGGEEQTEANADTNNPAEQPPAGTAPPVNPAMVPTAAQPKPAAVPNAAVAKTPNPFLQTKAAAPRVEVKKPTVPPPAQAAVPATPTKPAPTTSPVAESKPVAAPSAPAAKTENPVMQTKPPLAPAEPELSLEEPIAPGSETSAPAAPAEPKLSLEPTASASESSAPTASPEPELSLELEPVEPDTESSSPPAAKTETAPQPEPSIDTSSLSLEDELEKDLERLMEDGQQQQPVKSETTNDPFSASGKPDIDLSSPDSLEIDFEDADNASDQDNSAPKK